MEAVAWATEAALREMGSWEATVDAQAAAA